MNLVEANITRETGGVWAVPSKLPSRKREHRKEGGASSPCLQDQESARRDFDVKIVILGCGRVGSTLANMMDRDGHTVSIIDYNSDAFRRLDSQFSGETIVGNGVDEELLIRAGIKEADAFVAVTNGDNRNVMASQIAKEIFNIKKVVCRIYDPIRESTYRELGLETFCPTVIGAQMLFDVLVGSKKQA